MTIHRVPMCRCGHEAHPDIVCPRCGCERSTRRDSPIPSEAGVSSDALAELRRLAHTIELAATVFRKNARALIDALDRHERRAPSRSNGQVVAALAPSAAAGLAVGLRMVLTALAQAWPGGLTRAALTILTGYKKTTRDLYVRQLRSLDLLRDDEVGYLYVTPKGQAALGAAYRPLPTGSALREHWLKKLPTGEAALLREACHAFPHAVGRDRLSEITGYKKTTRDLYLRKLAARHLVSTDASGVYASPALFDSATTANASQAMPS
jgi:hypothetical protein